MPKVGNNIVTTGLNGKLGNLIVFRNRGGKTDVIKTFQKNYKIKVQELAAWQRQMVNAI